MPSNDAPQARGEGHGQSNDLGGVPMFRGIDLPEAYRRQSYHDPTVSRETLQEWFSSARLSRYRIEPVDAWYVWNTRVSKAFLEDISHVEVLLRNFIDVRLNADAGIRCWWDSPKYQIGSFRNNVDKAKKRLQRAKLKATPDQIVASLSLDNWRFLLTQRLEATVWKALTTFATEACPTTRAVAEPISKLTWSSSVASVTAPPTKNPSSTRILTNKRRFAGLPVT